MATAPTAYLLLFRNTGPENIAHLSAEERQDLTVRWNAWYDRLIADGKAVEGQPLRTTTRVVSGRGGASVMDGPFTETKEAIGGYCKLMVGSLEEATEIARQHPGLAYGLRIEVREMVDLCHLAVHARTPA